MLLAGECFNARAEDLGAVSKRRPATQAPAAKLAPKATTTTMIWTGGREELLGIAQGPPDQVRVSVRDGIEPFPGGCRVMRRASANIIAFDGGFRALPGIIDHPDPAVELRDLFLRRGEKGIVALQKGIHGTIAGLAGWKTRQPVLRSRHIAIRPLFDNAGESAVLQRSRFQRDGPIG